MRHAPFIPVGTVLPYAGPAANSEDGIDGIRIQEIAARLAQDGWLFCDGRQLDIHAYRVLYGVLGKAFGGDATTFRLPDLRGRFIRGVSGTLAGGPPRDPDVAQRGAPADGGNTGNRVGSLQQDAFQGHEHDYQSLSDEAAPTLGPAEAPTAGIGTQTTTSQFQESDDYGAPRVSSETRPANLYLNYLIRYR